MNVLINLRDYFVGLVGPTIGIALIAILIILLLTFIPFVIGWLIVAFVGFFAEVAITGYFTHALIGFVAMVIVGMLR